MCIKAGLRSVLLEIRGFPDQLKWKTDRVGDIHGLYACSDIWRIIQHYSAWLIEFVTPCG